MIPVIVGLNEVEVYPAGPAHDQLLPDVTPVKVTLPPGHTGLELDAVAVVPHNDQRYTWLTAGKAFIIFHVVLGTGAGPKLEECGNQQERLQ